MGQIKETAEKVHKIAVEHGWWEEGKERSFGELIALVHSEASEALEAYRERKPGLVPEELADIIIRVFDMAEGLDIDIEHAILRKMRINESRPYRHGGKRL